MYVRVCGTGGPRRQMPVRPSSDRQPPYRSRARLSAAYRASARGPPVPTKARAAYCPLEWGRAGPVAPYMAARPANWSLEGERAGPMACCL